MMNRLALAIMLWFGILAAPARAQVPLETSKQSAEAVSCEGCPTFVPVPTPPSPMRRIIYVATVELTWNQYLSAFDEGACPIPRTDFPFNKSKGKREIDGHVELFRIDWPVTLLGPEEIACYARWLSTKLERKVVIPTAAEWLWFARSGRTDIKFPWGNEPREGMAAIGGRNAVKDGVLKDRVRVPYKDWQRARYVNRHLSALEVAQFPPTEWGLYDILGNAWEITSDISYRQPYSSEASDGSSELQRFRIVGESWGLENWQEATRLEGDPNYVSVHDGRFSSGVAVRYVLLE